MSKTDAWKAWEGRVVDGKYQLRQWIGGSDHSAVFLTDKAGKPGEKAAIKLMDFGKADLDKEVSRLRQSAKLSHPHLLAIYDAGRAKLDSSTVVYAVMEHADEDLSQILPQRPLSPGEVSDMLPPVLDGLKYLHSNGWVHSRLRPSNVHAAGDQLKLSADQLSPVGSPNPSRRVVGVFDAPELASANISPAADVWSLGVTIITAITQQANPAAAGTTAKPGTEGALPEPFSGIVRECLHIEPQRRCTLDYIRDRLRPAETPAPVHAVSDTAHKGERDTNRLPMFVIPLVLVVLALAAWGLFHSRSKDSAVQDSENKSAPAVTQPATPVTTQPKPSPTGAAPVSTSKKTATGAGGSVTHQVMPDIPQSARNTIRGTIKIAVQVQVDASGKVTSAKFKSAGPSRYFADRTMKAAEQWQFSPPVSDGQPTTSAWLIQFRLRRNGVQASPQRVTH